MFKVHLRAKSSKGLNIGRSKLAIIVLMFIMATTQTVLPVAIYSNVIAQQAIGAAHASLDNADFGNALYISLNTSNLFVLPSSSAELNTLKDTSTRWLYDYQREVEIVNLLNKNDVEKANEIIAKVSEDYPFLNRITGLLDKTKSDITIKIENAKIAAQAEKEKEANKAKQQIEEQVATQPQPEVAPQAPATPTLSKAVARANNQLAAYGVNVTLSPQADQYNYSTWSALTELDATHLDSFITMLVQEYSKLPTDFVKNSGLKVIGVVKNLSVTGQGRTATLIPYQDTMIYDAIGLSGDSAYSRTVISHEYWHFIDYKYSGGNYAYADSDWTTCNPSGFSYGSGGSSAYSDPNYNEQFHPSTGFVTVYSKYAIEEDKSDLFGWLIYNPSKVKNLGDAKINCKINRLTQLARSFSPSFSF